MHTNYLCRPRCCKGLLIDRQSEPAGLAALVLGRFIWPTALEGAVTISPAQLGDLLEGIDGVGAR